MVVYVSVVLIDYLLCVESRRMEHFKHAAAHFQMKHTFPSTGCLLLLFKATCGVRVIPKACLWYADGEVLELSRFLITRKIFLFFKIRYLYSCYLYSWESWFDLKWFGQRHKQFTNIEDNERVNSDNRENKQLCTQHNVMVSIYWCYYWLIIIF